MRAPTARGPLSKVVLDRLTGATDTLDASSESFLPAHPLLDDDFQLALWSLYELHYRGFDDVEESLEWDPDLIRFRGELERVFEDALRSLTDATVQAASAATGDLPDRLNELIDGVEGPSLSRYVQREATLEQFLEFMVQRSVYHLKESDPSSWVIARLGSGAPKARLVELQYDEYGAGQPERLHAGMFGDALTGSGLSPTYGAYVDRVPGYTLAVNNAMSLFGLHRRLRGAAMGHLAAFEATSSLPSRRYAMGIRRLGLGDHVAGYFDEHIEADAVHEQLAVRDICGGLVEEDPRLERDVLFGAAVCMQLEALVAEQMLEAWAAGESSVLREPEGASA